MGVFDLFTGTASLPTSRVEPSISASAPQQQTAPSSSGLDAGAFFSFDDPAFKEFLRGGSGSATEAGLTITPKIAMRNTTVLRCVSLISFAIGMLPLHLQRKDDKSKASDHALYRILHRKPNAWQTSFEFRSLMQQRALVDGDAFAMIVRSGPKILQLVPIESSRVTVKQRADWTLEYHVDRGSQGRTVLQQKDVFHLRYGISENGYTGLSLVKQAAEAIALAIQTQAAAARLFRNGMLVGGILKHKKQISPEAYSRLMASLEDKRGAGNAHKDLILEEDMDYKEGGANGRDSQGIEQRKLQIEEIARPFGVPRPLLGVDDTSWGTGIDVLGQMFVRYGLNPWFECWQQAVERSLLTEKEADELEVKFNPGGLLRGSMKDQAEFFAKALGSGGHASWMSQEEIREISDLPSIDRSKLPAAPGQQPTGGSE